jgi:hypothetical protein
MHFNNAFPGDFRYSWSKSLQGVHYSIRAVRKISHKICRRTIGILRQSLIVEQDSMFPKWTTYRQIEAARYHRQPKGS